MRSSFALPGRRALPVWSQQLTRCVLIGLLCAGTVLAGLSTTPSRVEAQDAKARARSLFGEGVAAYERGDFENALESFTQAYRLAPHPTVRVNMANCYEQLGRFAEASFNYERFLEESGTNVSPEQRTEVQAAIERLRLKFGSVLVETDPADVSLSVDGAPAPRGLDGRMQLRAGNHLLRATKPGYANVERAIEVQGGADQTLRLVLEPIGAPPVAVVEPTPVQEQAPPFLAQAEPEEQKHRGSLRPAMWASLTVGALLVISAGVSGGMALKAQHDFDDAVARTKDPEASQIEIDQARSEGLDASERTDKLALVTDVLLVGGVLGASTALVLWLIDRGRPEREPAVAFGPGVDAHGARMLLRGSF